MAIELTWECSSKVKGEFKVSLSESEDMAQAKVYTTNEPSLSVYNLKVATTYYWTVETDNAMSNVASFTTADSAPRNIYCDGITNMRDLGGWKTADGARIKQGLVYRSGEWCLPASKVVITEEGIAVMKELGIVTQVDLRSEASGKDPCPVDGVTVFHIPMDASGDIRSNTCEAVVKFFEILADESNYPLVFHCKHGTDRTGYMAFLINALLGVEEENLYRDYLFSNFAAIDGDRKITHIKNKYVDHILGYGKGTSAENCEAYLLDIGVKQEHIDAVKAILLEK